MKYNKAIFTLTILATIISFMLGISYAYFSINTVGNETASTQLITTANLKITYQGTDTIDTDNMEPGDTTSTTFTVKNTGSVSINNYQVYFSKVLNEIINDEMTYTLNCQSSDTNPCLGKEETPLPKQVGSALTQPSIAPGITHTYTLSVTFKDTGSNQDYNQNKRVSFKITINEQQDFGTLVARQNWNSTELFWEHSANITEITFEDSINIPNGVTSWDTSANQDESVMAYIIDDGLGTNTYKLYIQSNGILFANSNSSNLFQGFSKLKTINNLSSFTTSNVTNMETMFAHCSSLTSLDLSTFDTSSVTRMSGIFYNCSSLTSLDLSTFDTSSVTDMSSMFLWCDSLTSLDLSTFDTSSVTTMYAMFWDCASLASLDLSSFDTSSVTSIGSMFQGCSSLTSLDLSTFDTSSVTDMFSMFSGCSGLTNLNLSKATFTSVTLYNGMFNNITSGINIIVKDVDAQTFINARLSDASRTGNVTIYVP